MERKIKAWLKPNLLTEDKSDYICVVDSFGSIAAKGIIEELVAEGMELKPETVFDVVTRYNRKCIDLVLRGYNVNQGIVLMHPTIKGVFMDKKWDSEKNKLYVSISQGVDLRAAAAETTVEILGVHADPIALFNITDLSTGKTDGSITMGLNVELKGSLIKIAGENAANGIYFKDLSSGDIIKVEKQYIAKNDPSSLLFIVPNELRKSSYEVSVTTQYSTNKILLNSPRTITLPYPVVVE